MSVNLYCPNCEATVGEASSEDNYRSKYYHKGNDEQPICKNCGAGTYKDITIKIVSYVFLILGIIMVMIFIFS